MTYFGVRASNRGWRKPKPVADKAVGPPVKHSDAVVLDILDRVERQGQSMAEAGEAHGMSRSGVAGLLKWVRDELAASEVAAPGEALAEKPWNLDGGMPVCWWKAGLAARRVYA